MSYVEVNPRTDGFVMADQDGVCIFRGATSAPIGTVVALCINDSDDISDDGLTVYPNPNGLEASMFGSVTSDYALRACRHGIFGVLLEAATDGNPVRVRFSGRVEALLRSRTNATYSAGYGLAVGHDDLTNGVSGYLEWTTSGPNGETAGDDRKMVGLALDNSFTASPTSTGQLTAVLFDGINGLGSSAV